MKTLWLTATLAAALTACSTPATPPATQTLKKPALDRIAAASAAATSADFRQFLALAIPRHDREIAAGQPHEDRPDVEEIHQAVEADAGDESAPTRVDHG